MPEKEGSARTTRPKACSLKIYCTHDQLAMAPFHPKDMKEPNADKLAYFMLFMIKELLSLKHLLITCYRYLSSCHP